jgi:hypothetical protein
MSYRPLLRFDPPKHPELASRHSPSTRPDELIHPGSIAACGESMILLVSSEAMAAAAFHQQLERLVERDVQLTCDRPCGKPAAQNEQHLSGDGGIDVATEKALGELNLAAMAGGSGSALCSWLMLRIRFLGTLGAGVRFVRD